METNDTVDDVIEMTNAKVVIGIRETPAFKELFEKEAKERGMTGSEYGRMILRNRHGNKEEVERLMQLVSEQKKVIDDLRMQKGKDETNQLELFGSVKEELLQHIESLNSQLAILHDPQLHYLFDQVKFLRDTIHAPDGRLYSIQYNTPLDLLFAMIYSYKLKS